MPNVDGAWFDDDEGALPLGAPFRPGLDPLPRRQHAWAVVKDRCGPAGARRAARGAAPRHHPGAGASAPRGDRLRPLRRAHVQHDVRRARRADLGLRPARPRPARAGQRRRRAGGRARQRDGARGPAQDGRAARALSGRVRICCRRAPGEDPMHADFKIQGYETPDGSFCQFVRCQAPQLLAHSERLTLPEGSSYMLDLETVYKALFDVARVGRGRARVRRGRRRRHRALRGRVRRAARRPGDGPGVHRRTRAGSCSAAAVARS